MAGNYLFVYGTLLHGDNEFAVYMKNNCSFHAKGQFKGRLYDIGEYPGAVADNNYTGYVYGSIFILNDTETALKFLDDYEGFGAEQEQPNLFIRKLVEIVGDKGMINCWCYLYNLSVEGLRMIESGDYLDYKGI